MASSFRGEDDDGPRVGQGAWVNSRWQDPLDPDPVPQRERRSMEALDPDYEPEQHQVMNTRLITTKHSIHFHRLRIRTMNRINHVGIDWTG